MKLYEFAPTRSIRVRWTLQELGVDFESVDVRLPQGENRTPDFLKLNPAAKLPVLVDGDFVLTESVAICLYLADKYPQKKLAPTDLKQRADMNRWLLFTATELEQPLWRIARNSFIYPQNERQPRDVEIAGRDFRQMAAVMEAHVRDQEFVLGGTVSIADFVLAYTLDWANENSLLAECPRLRAYMERMYARPKAAMRIADALKRVGGN